MILNYNLSFCSEADMGNKKKTEVCPLFLKAELWNRKDTVKVLHSICQQIWKTQQWPRDWKRSVFTPVPKTGNAKKCSNSCIYLTC